MHGDRNHAIRKIRRWLEGDAFELHCQPIVSLRSSAMAYSMGEVLIRLRERDDALRAPGEFLPLLEDCGMMPALDRWVVRAALRRMADGSRIARFAINLSRHSVTDRTFSQFLARELLAFGIEGENLLFEIDEADALVDLKATAKFAAMVRSLGAAIAIDRFGHAADCGNLLAMGGFEVIKLECAMTRQIIANAPDLRWRMLLSELPKMGLRLVAGQVENAGDIDPLRAMNIDYAQGFGLHEPRSIAHFSAPAALEAA